MTPRRLATLLFVVFGIALFMGPGPGNLLINPDPADPDARRFVFGLPIVYAWALLWFGVQAACIVAAYFFLWRDDDRPSTDDDGLSKGGEVEP